MAAKPRPYSVLWAKSISSDEASGAAALRLFVGNAWNAKPAPNQIVIDLKRSRPCGGLNASTVSE
jgi:hypothetical protein